MRGLLLLGIVLAEAVASAAVSYKFGVAGFTFRDRTLDEALAIMRKADVHYLCVKDYHLPYDSDDAAIAAFRKKCADAGVVPYALGPLYVKDAGKLRDFFAFARRMGVKTVVGVPYEPADAKDTWEKRKASRVLLKEVDKLVREFDIRFAIHNHGPYLPDLFPDVESVWELVRDLDPRIGFCLDVGWEQSCGRDPVKTIREHGDRLFDVHLKNSAVGKSDGATVPLPRGKIDYVRILAALSEIGYDGVCALEYEKDFKDNLAPIAESIGYVRGIADAISGRE